MLHAAPPPHPTLSPKWGRGDVSAAFTFGKNRVGTSCPRQDPLYQVWEREGPDARSAAGG